MAVLPSNEPFNNAVADFSNTMSALDCLLETTGTRVKALSDRIREKDLVISSLTTRATLAESKLKHSLDDLAFVRAHQIDAIATAQQVTALQAQNQELIAKAATLTEELQKMKQELSISQNELSKAQADKKHMESQWKVFMADLQKQSSS